jgi:Flp pilus assembly protein TadG
MISTRKLCFGSGQTTIEFALTATVLFMMFFGIILLSWDVYQYNMVSSAAREAVRYAIVHSPTGPNPATTAQIQQVAINYAPALKLTTSDVAVSFPADVNLPSKTDAEVAITYPYKFQIPFLPAISVTLTSTSHMLVSQ